MRPAHVATFDSRAEFHAAIIEALDLCRHSVTLLDRSFEGWPLESAAGEHALRGALRRGALVHVLVGQNDWLARNGTRFMRTRRAFARQMDCREYPAALRIDESILLGDGQHLVRRVHWDGFRGQIALASPSEVEPLMPRYAQVWDESSVCLPATTLGL
jgi:hypothetical protein